MSMRIIKGTALPSTLVPNAIYLIAKDGNMFDMYIVNSSGTAARQVSAASSASTSLLSGLGVNVWEEVTLPGQYPVGIQSSFVEPTTGFPGYGTVMTVKGYSGGGGTLQMFTPYGHTITGDSLKVRFGNYDNNSGNSWTTWKTLLADDNFNRYAPTLSGGGAIGLWNISVSGNASSAATLQLQPSAIPEDTGVSPPTGVSFRHVYNNGFPIPYGNLLSLGGQGAGQLLIGWSGVTGEPADNFIRNKRDNYGSVWSDWSKIITDTNISNYAPGVTGGGATGTWGISINGNAATASALSAGSDRNKLDSITGTNTGDQVLPTSLPASDVYAWAKSPTKPTYVASEVGAPSGSGTSSGTNTGDQTNITGNAGTATKLATPRTINGVSFDGSANITISFSQNVYNVSASMLSSSYIPSDYSSNNFSLIRDDGNYCNLSDGTETCVFNIKSSSAHIHQLAFSANSTMWLRSNASSSTWAAWKKLWDSSNLTNLNQLTNGPGYTTNVGTVTAVTGTGAISSSGGATPEISIVAATTSVPGTMSALDKTKLNGITGTNTGDETTTTIKTKLGINTAATILSSETDGSMRVPGLMFKYQPMPTSGINTTSTLTAAHILRLIIICAPVANITLTMPTGTALDAAIAGLNIGQSIEYTIINSSTFNVTIASNTGIFLYGPTSLIGSSSGRFLLLKTASNSFNVYRISS